MASQVTEMLVVAVPAAVLSAASFGLGSAVQHWATKQVPPAAPGDPRLLFRLVRQPAWLLGVCAVALGFALQMVALAFGPLVLVQPLLVTSVLFGTVFSAMLARRRLDGQILLGATACVVGLAALLTMFRPSDTGGAFADLPHLVPLAVALAVIIAGCMVAAIRIRGAARVAALAVACGVLYGLTAGLAKVITGQLRAGGLGEVLGHPALYVICLLGPLGFLLSQHAFQQGTLLAPALAIITIVDPLVGLAIGVSWLGERITTTGPLLVGESLAGAVVVTGIALLARRGSQIRQQVEEAGAQRR
jgi:drug/metabolite transporter (DMT)-like permease